MTGVGLTLFVGLEPTRVRGNKALETGSPLRNKTLEVLTKNRTQPITLTGDLGQAFFQIWAREQDHDVLRFHWQRNRNLEMIGRYRFKRLPFGVLYASEIFQADVAENLEGMQGVQKS